MRKVYALLVSMAIAFSFVAVTEAQAEAVSGCKGHGTSAHWKFNVFDGTTISIRSGSVDPGKHKTAQKQVFHNSKFRAWGDMKYIFCKDKGFNRVLPVTYKFCVRKLDNDMSQSRYHEFIHGWWFDPYIGTWHGAQVVNPKQIGFHWNGDGRRDDTHCTDWSVIPWTDRKWMRTKLQPYWVVNGHVDIRYAKDKHFKFVKNNSRFRRLSPHNDVSIGG